MESDAMMTMQDSTENEVPNSARCARKASRMDSLVLLADLATWQDLAAREPDATISLVFLSGKEAQGPGKTAASSLLRPETVTPPDPLKDDGEQSTDVDGKRNARTLAVTLDFHAVANLAAELLLVDATEAKVLQFMRTVTRPDRCYLAGVVATAETVVVVYSDGALAWLQIGTWELLTTGMLPGGLTGSSVTVMTNFAKAHVGTRNSKIFEIRTTVLQDDEEDADNEEEESNTHRSTQSNRGNDETALVARMRVARSARLVVAPCSHHVERFEWLWGLRDCRQAAEINIAALFSQDPAAIGAPMDSNSRPGSSTTDLNTESTTIPSPVVITALASRPGDPIVMIGDYQGSLRSFCRSVVRKLSAEERLTSELGSYAQRWQDR
ncbi:hypothetical protein GQ600_23453 [Phytophthora cactorum]|nr:hypothetical protein GQ600_23453 [Phytophthora cactorum]